jgi:hypothetical protein
MNIQHTCKFCSAPVTLELNDAMLAFMRLDRWKSFAACNRCADFREMKRNLIEQLLRCVSDWYRYQEKQIILKEPAIEKLRLAIVELTRKFAQLVCGFHRSHFIWEPDFAQQIMDKPVKTLTCLSIYENGVRRKTP